MQLYDASGIKIRVCGTGEPFVFLHGWGVDADIWLNLVPFLTPRYQVYLVNMPGFGASEELSIDDFAEVLQQFLPKNFTLLGWSLGGLRALELLPRLAIHIKNLILVATSPRFTLASNWPGLNPKVLQAFMIAFKKSPLNFLKNFVFKYIDSKALISNLPASEAALLSGLDALLNLDLRALVQEYKLPIKWIFGRNDAIIPITLAPIIKRLYNCELFIFENSAHVPFFTEMQKFITVIGDP